MNTKSNAEVEKLSVVLSDEWVRIRLPRGEWFYNPTKPLGPAGGFGEVFDGKNEAGQSVAVKRLKMTAGEAAHRELKIADELAGRSFEHVLQVLDSGEDSGAGGYYIVMPRAECSLADALNERGVIPPTEAADVLRQIAEGLKEVEDIVHRDLKPGNVLYHNGKWKIADFGIARFVEDATSTHTVRGFLSPQYAAPEQWLGEHATHATDIYALSCVSYVLLRGEPPFPGPTMEDFKRQHTSQTPPLLTGADSRLRAIFAAGLRKPPSGRPTMERLIAVLREVSSTPTPRAPGIAALQAINAIEAEKVSAAQAEAERERRASAERNALIKTGEAALLDIIGKLEVMARDNAPEAQIIQIPRTGGLAITMGQAQMVIDLEGAVPPNTRFPSARWEVLAIGRIHVKQGAPPWNHGATVWYMRLRPDTGYRWYEVSYKRHALFAGPLIGPFAIQELGYDIYGEADRAAGPGMHTIEVESGPVAIDDENSDSFFERWLTRLAQAYQGRLRPF
jgi:eukaryotic-like serine/threonine-protein kinase